VKAAILTGKGIISTRKRDGRMTEELSEATRTGVKADMKTRITGTMADTMVIMTTDTVVRHSKRPHFLGNAAFFTPNFAESRVGP
jgi:hypothetical protein